MDVPYPGQGHKQKYQRFSDMDAASQSNPFLVRGKSGAASFKVSKHWSVGVNTSHCQIPMIGASHHLLKREA